MTSAEARDVAARCRKKILDGEVSIVADNDHPISVDPFSDEFPFVTNAPVEFTIGGEVITVEAGFKFDGASIPAAAWMLLLVLQFLGWLFGLRWIAPRNWCAPLNTFRKILYAALLHDWAWRRTHYGRRIGKRLSNAAFEAVLVSSGVHWCIARVMYVAVSFGGNRTYRRYADINERRLRVLAMAAEQERNDRA